MEVFLDFSFFFSLYIFKKKLEKKIQNLKNGKIKTKNLEKTCENQELTHSKRLNGEIYNRRRRR